MKKDSQLSFSLRGGKREGAGRKKIGTTKRVSITLSNEHWEFIQRVHESRDHANLSMTLRFIIEEAYIGWDK
jgi:sulfur relay (sulfurtransferase) DsrC/TusE family protein